MVAPVGLGRDLAGVVRAQAGFDDDAGPSCPCMLGLGYGVGQDSIRVLCVIAHVDGDMNESDRVGVLELSGGGLRSAS